MTELPINESDQSEAQQNRMLACPNCSTLLSPNHMCCEGCGITACVREGVVSFDDEMGESQWHLSDYEPDETARVVKNRLTNADSDDNLGEEGSLDNALGELFDVRRDLWTVLVDEHITGRCLDLYAGYGRRSMMLAELADSVYAVDPALEKLQIAAGREDFAAADQVIPVHTGLDQLPFEPGSFDTIVVDLTKKSDVESTLRRVQRYLDDDGSLFFLANGWPRTTRFTSLVGWEEGDFDAPWRSIPSTAKGYRSLAEAIGFDEVSIYSLFPTITRPLYAFDIECDDAVRWLFESTLPNRDSMANKIEQLFPLLRKSGLLKWCYPSYLVACSNDPITSSIEFTAPLAVAGRARSVVLDIGTTDIENVWKIPNRSAHVPQTERENMLLSRLKSTNAGFTETLPDGEAVESPFGEVRRENPVTGRPLDEELTDDPESFQHVLDVGYEWLTQFQRSVRSDDKLRSPAEVRDALSFEPANVKPPTVEEPVETFTTPVHGDFIPRNIHFANGSITCVIDWEYGVASGSPVVDAGLLLLDAASQIAGDFEEGVRTFLCSDTEYADRTRQSVRHYCDAVGLPYRTFEQYLPVTYIHRLAVDWRIGATSTYTMRMERLAHRAQTLVDAVDDMTISQ